MSRRRRKFDIFSMSFLDTICCAFGAIVLLYMILNAAGNRSFKNETAELQAEVDKLEEEVLQGYSDLVVLRNSLRTTLTEAERAEGLSDRVLQETEKAKEQLADASKTAVSRREAIERLKADLKQIEAEKKRLVAGTPAPGKPGNRVKGFVGSGDRQYLSGLKLGGERIVILVDVSASMLDETVVNVIRLRNMPESRRLRSEKWRRTVATVDWLTAQIPAKSKFQVLAFNVKAWSLAPNSDGRWLEGSDAQALERRDHEPAAHGAGRRHQPRERVHADEHAEPGPRQRVHHYGRLADAGRHAPGAAPDDRRRWPSQAVRARARQVPEPRAGERDPAADGGRSGRLERVLDPRAPHQRRVPHACPGLAMKRRRARDFEVFSMSFLDTICCAFGAIILLFMLSKFGEPKALEKSRLDLEGRLLALQEERYEMRGETEILNRDLTERERQLSEVKQKLARLRGDLSDVKGQYQASNQDAEVANKLEGQLVSAQQELTDEMKKVLGAEFRRAPQDSVAGLPVDSEYIIFIIDTSGSMANYAWPLMLRKMQEVLDAYPTVKGWQVMSDEGVYMFPSYRGRWLPDTPSQRKIVLDRLRDWFPFSNSSPVEGIVEAIRTYHATGRRISLYVVGDEFTGSSIDSVVRAVDLINREDGTGERRVRIHALGFPVRPDAPQFTSVRFATLMRVLCARNGGTFVGLNEPASYRR